jgi:hypothetical protein
MTRNLKLALILAGADNVGRPGYHARGIGCEEDHDWCDILTFDPRCAEQCLGDENLPGLGLV